MKPDDLLDTVFPLDQGIVSMAMIQRPDTDVRLDGNEFFCMPQGRCIPRAVERDDLAESVRLSQPNRVRHIRPDIRDHIVNGAIQHRFTRHAGLESLLKSEFQTFQPIPVYRGARLPKGKNIIVNRSDGIAEDNLLLVTRQF